MVEVIALVLAMALIVLMIYTVMQYNRFQHMIEQQQNTIQRLVNKEPVTYAEIGTEPLKPERIVYSAWGNEEVNLRELE